MKRKFISLLLLPITFASLNIFTQIQQFTYAGAANGNDANSDFLPNNAFKTTGKTSDLIRQSNIPEVNILAEKEIYSPYNENDLLTIPAISIFNVTQWSQTGWKRTRVLKKYSFTINPKAAIFIDVIYFINGKTIQAKRFAVGGTYQLNVAKLPPGIYFIKVNSGETYKLIKQ